MVQNSQAIVERLRAFDAYPVCREAADHVERLTDEIERLRKQVAIVMEALRHIRDISASVSTVTASNPSGNSRETS